MAVFKPITFSASSAKSELKKNNQSTDFNPTTKTLMTRAEIIQNTTERIAIIYDDSGSMFETVRNDNNSFTTKTKLAAEGTVEFLRYVEPSVTSVELKPLNEPAFALTKDIPALALKIKNHFWANGQTPLFANLAELVQKHKETKYTRALIFTDGEATDNYTPGLFEDLKAMKIPIDFIIIKDTNDINNKQSAIELQIKALSEETGGTFLITADAISFKEKLKYFAPLLRHLLPSITSEGN